MAKNTETQKKVVENVEKKEQIEEGRISLMPNWENTKTWLMVCSQIISQRTKTPTANACLRKVDKTDKEYEKFILIANFATDQIAILSKRIESLKSVQEIANYEVSLLTKKESEKNE